MEKIALPVIGLPGGAQLSGEQVDAQTYALETDMLEARLDQLKRRAPLIIYNLDTEQEATVTIVREETEAEAEDITYHYAVTTIDEDSEDDLGAFRLAALEWHEATTAGGTAHKVPVGQALLMRSDTARNWGRAWTDGVRCANIIRCDRPFALGGRLSALSGKVERTKFSALFKGNATLKRVSRGFLSDMRPQEDFVYARMFQDCTSLEQAPDLPARYFNNCAEYASMFQGCVSLEVAPHLLAEQIPDEFAYTNMFQGCTSLRYVCAYFSFAGDPTDAYGVKGWLDGVAAKGVLVVGRHNHLTRESLGVPEGWEVYDEDSDPGSDYIPGEDPGGSGGGDGDLGDDLE